MQHAASELAALRHKIEVSQRIIAQGPAEGEDPVIHQIVSQELERDMPRLERRVAQLEGYVGTERDRRRA